MKSKTPYVERDSLEEVAADPSGLNQDTMGAELDDRAFCRRIHEEVVKVQNPRLAGIVAEIEAAVRALENNQN